MARRAGHACAGAAGRVPKRAARAARSSGSGGGGTNTATARTAHRLGAGRRGGPRLCAHRRHSGAGRSRHPARPGRRHVGRQPGSRAVCIGQDRRRDGHAGVGHGRRRHHRLGLSQPRFDPWRGAGALCARADRGPCHRADEAAAGHRGHAPGQRRGGAVPAWRHRRGSARVQRRAGGVSAGEDRGRRVRGRRPCFAGAGALCAPDGG